MFAILRASKLKKKIQISGSGSHTYRDIPPLNADPKLTRLNQHGQVHSAEELLSAISARLPASRRKDAVLAIEYLVGASPEWFTSQQRNAGNDYFSDALRWIVQRHGEANVVGWAVHRDEGTPHLVCYVVPLDPQTGRLNASRWLDGRQKLSRMQTEFADAVGRRHGLERGIEGSRATHQKVRQWYAQIMRPDPGLKFSPQDLQLRQGETLAECAARLNAKIETELKPTFSAAKVSKSATSLAKSLASTAKDLRRQHDQIIRLCEPVLRLHSASPRAFDELMNQVEQQLQRLQREARIKREDIRAQSLARTASQGKDQLASRHKTAPDIVEPIPHAATSPVAPASDVQADFDWSVGLDR
jgi:cell division septum initiation protein DivIVA